MKKKALFVGNCQSAAIRYYLNKNKDFSSVYDTKLYTNWEMIREEQTLPTIDLQTADLFLYQPLPPVHGCYSTDPTVKDSIGSFVKSDCIKISHPYVFSSAFWPIYEVRRGGWFGFEAIDKLILDGLNLQDIMNLYENNSIDWLYGNRMNESISILKSKEELTDIKMSDFILQNYQSSLLFLTPPHPTSTIVNEMANRILEKLGFETNNHIVEGINDFGFEDSCYSRPSRMYPIHKSAADFFGFTFADPYISDSHVFFRQRIVDYFNSKADHSTFRDDIKGFV